MYETKNPSTLPSMSSILIYFQSQIQSEASDSQLAARKIADPSFSCQDHLAFIGKWSTLSQKRQT
jgi:hypothetical protein